MAYGNWKSVLSTLEEFGSSICFCACVGDRICFWSHIWCGSTSFCDRFPLLYNIASNPHSTVFENYVYQGGQVVWSLTFQRALHDEEIQVYSDCLLQLAGYFVLPNGKDSRVWSLDPKGAF